MQGNLTARTDHVEGLFMEEDIASLPMPVQKYFRYCEVFLRHLQLLFPDLLPKIMFNLSRTHRYFGTFEGSGRHLFLVVPMTNFHPYPIPANYVIGYRHTY